jgi:hypothetical protein
MAENSGMRLEL